jgi:hypothetical protein
VDTLAALVKAFVPGSFPFLLLVSGVGVLLLFSSRTMAWGRLLAALLIAYLTLSLPAVARWLDSGLHPAYAPIDEVTDAKGARTIVVLGNGVVSYSDERRAVHALTRRTAMNVLEGARLSRDDTHSHAAGARAVRPAGVRRRALSCLHRVRARFDVLERTAPSEPQHASHERARRVRATSAHQGKVEK